MSGEVADRACQIFTLCFYQALLRGVPISCAAAQGRRAALLDFAEDVHNVEWARPTMFVAEGIDPKLKIQEAARDWSGVAERYRKLTTPEALCDRFDCMDRYEEFRKSLVTPIGRSAVIAFVSKDPLGGLGKTRLLEEIAARSVFDNFLPVIVRNNQENPDAPQNYLEMALQISTAIEDTRENFGLERAPLTMTRQFAHSLMGPEHNNPNPNDLVKFTQLETELDDYLRQNRVRGKPADVKIERVLPLIQAEFEALRTELTVPKQQAPTVLLLLDDLHRYAGCVQAILPRIREFGLGRADLPIPVVFTCNAVEEDKVLEEALRGRRDIPAIPLEAFETGVVQRMACRQFVLSYWKVSVTSRREKKDLVQAFYDSINEYTKGRPKQFLKTEVEVVVNTHRRIKTLVPTNFEEMLSKWK